MYDLVIVNGDPRTHAAWGLPDQSGVFRTFCREDAARTVLHTATVRPECPDCLSGFRCGATVRASAGETCSLKAGHRGYHSAATFDCDGCGGTYRGQPYRSGGDRWDPDAGLGFCFLCVREGERERYRPIED